uniref:Uncharacterized protein n=1 Tax=Zooxanthella nutricula TaxID=1333877 RepID=A0A7S2PTN4_9DINO
MAAARSAPPCRVRDVDLLGCWIDNTGNTILVTPCGQRGGLLTARFMHPPREDFCLDLRRVASSATWHCGSASLDLDLSAPQRLRWVFSGGGVSIWTWKAFTLPALKAHGIPMSTLQESPDLEGADSQCEWVPVCIMLGADESPDFMSRQDIGVSQAWSTDSGSYSG